MDKQEWLNRCAARYVEKAGVTQEQATYFAMNCYENQDAFPGMEFSEAIDYNPEVCADEDMREWVRNT